MLYTDVSGLELYRLYANEPLDVLNTKPIQYACIRRPSIWQQKHLISLSTRSCCKRSISLLNKIWVLVVNTSDDWLLRTLSAVSAGKSYLLPDGPLAGKWVLPAKSRYTRS